MRKSTLITSLAVFLVSLALQIAAQTNFVTGYIVTQQNDTLTGKIDYRNWENSPSYVRFSQKDTEHISMFVPGEIKGFYVEGEHYISTVVNHELSSLRIARLSDEAGLMLQTDTVFIMVLVSGHKNLFLYRSPAGRNNFYIGHADNPDLLIHKRFLIKKNGKTLAIDNNMYLAQLEEYLDCNTQLSGTAVQAYQERELIKAYKQYYQCAGLNPDYIKSPESNRPEVGILAAYTRTSTSVTTLPFTSFHKFTGVEFDPSHNFTAGIFADFPLRRRLGSLAITTELFYRSYLAAGNGFLQHNLYSSSTYQFELGGHQMGLYAGLRYRYRLPAGWLYAHAGMTNNFMLKPYNIEHREISNLHETRMETGPALEHFRVHEQGLVMALGYRLQRTSIEARIEFGNGFSSYSQLIFANRRYSFLARFFII